MSSPEVLLSEDDVIPAMFEIVVGRKDFLLPANNRLNRKQGYFEETGTILPGTSFHIPGVFTPHHAEYSQVNRLEAGTTWFIDSWKQRWKSDWMLPTPWRLWNTLQFSVAGNLAPLRFNRNRASAPAHTPHRRPANAFPSGRIICLQHKQLNL